MLEIKKNFYRLESYIFINYPQRLEVFVNEIFCNDPWTFDSKLSQPFRFITPAVVYAVWRKL